MRTWVPWTPHTCTHTHTHTKMSKMSKIIFASCQMNRFEHSCLWAWLYLDACLFSREGTYCVLNITPICHANKGLYCCLQVHATVYRAGTVILTRCKRFCFQGYRERNRGWKIQWILKRPQLMDRYWMIDVPCLAETRADAGPINKCVFIPLDPYQLLMAMPDFCLLLLLLQLEWFIS